MYILYIKLSCPSRRLLELCKPKSMQLHRMKDSGNESQSPHQSLTSSQREEKVPSKLFIHSLALS